MKNSLLILTLGVSFSFATPAFAQSQCLSLYSSPAIALADKLVREEGLSEANKSELVKILEADKGLIEYLSDPDYIAYVKGSAQGLTLTEMQPLLHKLWLKQVKLDQEAINLAETFKPALRQLFTDSTAVPKETRLQKVKRNAQKFWIQLMGITKSLSKVKKIIHQEIHPDHLDTGIWDFYGYLNLKLQSSRVRGWDKVAGSWKGIKLNDVVDIDPVIWSKFAKLAAEIEAPVDSYSDNAEVLRVLSPQATRFIGKTKEEADAHRADIAAGKKNGHCTNAWCFEESRHEGALDRMAQNIVGWMLPTDAPFAAYKNLDALDINDAFFRLISLNDNEWHAAGGYFFLGSHSKGALEGWIRNVRQDEVKHMSIFSGMYKYFKGDTYTERMQGMLKKAWAEFKEKSSDSEYGQAFSLTKEPLSALEAVYAHVIYEVQLRKYLRTLPLKTMRKIYETEIKLAPLPRTAIDPAKEKAVAEASLRETEIRVGLGRWPKKQREAALALEQFEAANDAALTKIINVLDFNGAEQFGSAKHLEITKLINDLNQNRVRMITGQQFSASDIILIKRSVTDTLRDYQIMNNSQVRELGLKVEFINAQKGFDTVRDATYDALRKLE